MDIFRNYTLKNPSYQKNFDQQCHHVIQDADQNDNFIVKESSISFSVFFKFQMDNSWSEREKLLREFNNFFLVERVKLKLSSEQVFILFWLSP